MCDFVGTRPLADRYVDRNGHDVCTCIAAADASVDATLSSIGPPVGSEGSSKVVSCNQEQQFCPDSRYVHTPVRQRSNSVVSQLPPLSRNFVRVGGRDIYLC